VAALPSCWTVLLAPGFPKSHSPAVVLSPDEFHARLDQGLLDSAKAAGPGIDAVVLDHVQGDDRKRRFLGQRASSIPVASTTHVRARSSEAEQPVSAMPCPTVVSGFDLSTGAGRPKKVNVAIGRCGFESPRRRKVSWPNGKAPPSSKNMPAPLGRALRQRSCSTGPKFEGYLNAFRSRVRIPPAMKMAAAQR
jgi:hypothetical protein